MKRNALISVFCALLFTNILANAKDIEGLIDNCSNGNRKACRDLEAAVRKLTDQALLAKVAVEATDADARAVAVGELTDQAVLAKIAVEDKDWYVRKVAVGKLTDKAVLAKIAVEDLNSDIRQAAVGNWNLNDQALLTKIAVEDKSAYVGRAAVGKLTDQGLLAKVAIESKESEVREVAVRKLTGQATPGKIAVGIGADVRYITVGEPTDQALLAKIAVESEDARVGSSALGKLTDEALLAKVAAESISSDIRQAAVGELTDQETLAKIAVSDKDPLVCMAAVGRLNDLLPSRTSAEGQEATQTGKYRALTPEDGLSCYFSQDLMFSIGGNFRGNVTARNHFDCTDKKGNKRGIALKSVESVNGRLEIKTEDFGTILRGNVEGSFDKYEMMESQIRKLRTFLGF
jgi:hypothetical protein